MRRHDLDWIRVLVFGLLIIYHIGMFFVPWGWHIKNNVISENITWPMLFVNQWRLASLFLISGMGTRFALAKRTQGQYIGERVKRLMVPLIFGMIVIIPPQVYVERLVYAGYDGSYLHFLFNDAFNGIYPEGNLSWHHLWFLPYLLLFSIVLTPVFVYLRDHTEAPILTFQRRLLTKSSYSIYWFILPLFLTEVLVEPFFPVTHALIDDWFSIILYIIIFLYGFNFISIGQSFWDALNHIKKKALAIGIISFGLYIFILQQEDGLFIHITEALVKTINFWSWMLVIFGYGAQYLNHPSKLLNYCNTAVYPFYILHQTVTVVLAYYVYQSDMNVWVKFCLLMVGTFLICFLVYEMIKRISILRPLFGLK